MKSAEDVAWWVFRALKKELLLTPKGANIEVNFGYLTNETFPKLRDVSRYIRKLQEQEILKIVGQTRSASEKYGLAFDLDNAYSFSLDIDQLKFDKLYREHERKRKDRKTRVVTPTKRELRKEIHNIIRAKNFGRKEKDFLIFLAKDFQPTLIEDIRKEISTSACTKLKASVQSKLKNTDFKITTHKNGLGGKSKYQLEYLLGSESS